MNLPKPSLPFRIKSINTKIMVALILTLSITPLLTYVYVQTSIREELIKEYSNDIQRNLSGQVNEIYLIYNDILDDLKFLYDTSPVHRFIDNPSDENRERLEETLLAYSSAHQIFDQVRIIDTYGMETIRINWVDGEAVIVPQDELQDKSDRDYFIDAIQLAPDEIYISNFDLNQENGILEVPYKPVVRIAVPLYYNYDTIQGILVVNVLTNSIFDIISNFDATKTYYVVNSVGDIMFTNVENDSEILYASDLGHDFDFETVSNISLDKLKTSDFQTDPDKDLVFRSASVTFSGVVNPQRWWYVVVQENLSDVASSVDNTIKGVLIIGGLGLLFSILLGILLTRSITRPLTALERATSYLKDKQWNESLALVSKIEAQDEIGKLAEVFAETLSTLQEAYDRQELIVRERTHELEMAHQELRQIDETKTQFVEHIAHDIATPLSSILMVVSRLRRTPEQYELLANRIETQTLQIVDLLNKIRDLRSLDALEYKLDEQIRLDEVVHTIIKQVEPQIINMHIEIVQDIQEVPEIWGNRFLLERLFENIYVNALKYTFEGEITVHLTCNDEYIVLKVEDTGIGIPEEDLPNIGKRFFRARNTPKEVIGTGMGMRIVNKSVDLHSGTVQIDSTLNKGTTITIQIPLYTKDTGVGV